MEKVEVVSLFGTGYEAYNISELSEVEIKKFKEADDKEEYAEQHCIEITMPILAEDSIDDNFWCIPDDQSTTKILVIDDSYEDGKVFKGGFKEYLGEFTENFTAYKYWDGSNWQLAIQNNEN